LPLDGARKLGLDLRKPLATRCVSPSAKPTMTTLSEQVGVVSSRQRK
jgi:hypothetical protein